MLDTLKIPGEEELLRAKPGQTVALTGINGTLAAALACRAARAGRRILLVTESGFQIRYLKPGMKPEAVFKIVEKPVEAYEYCNLHGLWKAEV